MREQRTTERSVWLGRTDLEDAVSWQSVLGATSVLLLIVVLYSAIGYVYEGGDVTTSAYVSSIGNQLRTIVPLVGIFFGYSAISRRREQQTLRLYLSAPLSRHDLFLGVLWSRTIATCLPITVAVVGIDLFAIYWAAPSLLTLLSFSVLTLALAISFASISVAVSALSATSRRALAVLLLLLVFGKTLWTFVALFVGIVSSPLGMIDTVSNIVSVLVPTQAYALLLDATLPAVDSPPTVVTIVAVISLLIWTVLPAVIGLRQFSQTDL